MKNRIIIHHNGADWEARDIRADSSTVIAFTSPSPDAVVAWAIGRSQGVTPIRCTRRDWLMLIALLIDNMMMVSVDFPDECYGGHEEERRPRLTVVGGSENASDWYAPRGEA